MTNQSLMLVSIVLCSLGGWYVVLTKYLELKAMSTKKPNNHDPDIVQLDPVNPDFLKLPENLNLNGKHIPGMGPPPHPNLPFSIPDELLSLMSKVRAGAKPEADIMTATNQSTQAAPTVTAAPVSLEKREICNWAAILHISGLAIITGIPFLNIVIPSVLWLLKKERHPFLAKQGRDVINFQITLTIIQFMCLLGGTFFTWYAPLSAQILFTWTKTMRVIFNTGMHLPCNIFTVIPFFWGCILMVRGAVAAYNGASYKYPYAQAFLLTTTASSAKSSVVAAAKVNAPAFNSMNFS